MSVTISKMDVSLAPFIIFFVCATLGLQNASAKNPGMTLEVDDGDMTCSTKYTTCSLTFDGKPMPERGEKGDVGSPGFNGTSGIDGAKGDRGLPGVPGAMGAKGDAGQRGEIGLQGPSGPSGLKGEKGESGKDGLPGIPGKNGEPGEDGKEGPAGLVGLPGPPGPVGPPGPSGSHGVCPCRETPNFREETETSDDFGTLDTPAQVPCKSADPSSVKSGTYHLGPPGTPFEVYCNMTTLETCIRTSKKTPECNHNPSKGAFWLNEMGVVMKELYDIVSPEQLIWLRDRSESVRQTLKYHCLDSVPYSKHNKSSSVKLWAWNDVVIGPYPTNQSPIFYSVPEATDECKEGSTEWKSTIIELQSTNVYRLPIVDLWIGDIRNAEQKMSIESIELCFG